MNVDRIIGMEQITKRNNVTYMAYKEADVNINCNPFGSQNWLGFIQPVRGEGMGEKKQSYEVSKDNLDDTDDRYNHNAEIDEYRMLLSRRIIENKENHEVTHESDHFKHGQLDRHVRNTAAEVKPYQENAEKWYSANTDPLHNAKVNSILSYYLKKKVLNTEVMQCSSSRVKEYRSSYIGHSSYIEQDLPQINIETEVNINGEMLLGEINELKADAIAIKSAYENLHIELYHVKKFLRNEKLLIDVKHGPW